MSRKTNQTIKYIMDPTKERYLKYVQTTLMELAREQYPGDTNLQRIFLIGFMYAQLAEAMYADSYAVNRFKSCVDKTKKRTKTNPRYVRK